MKGQRSRPWARVVIDSVLTSVLFVFPGPGSGQDDARDRRPKSPTLTAATSREGTGRGHHGGRRDGPSTVERDAVGPVGQLLQGRFDLRWLSWGDGSGVPTSGNNLVVLGTDNDDQLHIRIFGAGGQGVMDTDESKLSATHAVAIATLKRELVALSPPRVLTGHRKARVMRKVILLAARTAQDPRPGLRHGPNRGRSARSRTTRSRSGRRGGETANPGLSTGNNAR